MMILALEIFFAPTRGSGSVCFKYFANAKQKGMGMHAFVLEQILQKYIKNKRYIFIIVI